MLREQRDELRMNWEAIGKKSEAVVGGVRVVGELEERLWLQLLPKSERLLEAGGDKRMGAMVG